jgi:hypothetical protein
MASPSPLSRPPAGGTSRLPWPGRLLQGSAGVKHACLHADALGRAGGTYPVSSPRTLVTRLALCIYGLVAVLVAGCGEEPAREQGAGMSPAPRTITEEHSGRSFALAPGSGTALRLPGEYEWGEPAVRGEAVRLARVDYLQDPGFSEWIVAAVRPGTATIAALGAPAGAGRPLRFQVEIAVAP